MIHTYRKAVANGHALPVRCPEDDTEMVPVVDKNTEPAFKCLYCRTVFGIGMNTYDQIIAVVRDAVDMAQKENNDN